MALALRIELFMAITPHPFIVAMCGGNVWQHRKFHLAKPAVPDARSECKRALSTK
jgi:hypothetical protein